MNKLEMAHEYAKELVANYGDVMQFSEVLAKSWWLADAMFAEFEKREKEEAAKKRVEIQKLLNADNTFVEREGQHFDDVEWQPDWSLAPKWAEYWFATWDGNQITDGIWAEKEPVLVDFQNGVSGYSHLGRTEFSPSFGYTGDWRDSLRIRPEGV